MKKISLKNILKKTFNKASAPKKKNIKKKIAKVIKKNVTTKELINQKFQLI